MPTVSYTDCLFLQSKLHDANNKANYKILEKVGNLSDAITKLSSQLSITKNGNILTSRSVTFEQHCWANAQYSRQEFLNIVGIPHEVSGEILATAVLLIIVNPAIASAKKQHSYY